MTTNPRVRDWTEAELDVPGELREVVRAPAPVLSTVGERVDPTAPEVVQLAADLVATMRVSPGCVGLAAPQVGVGVKVFCVDVSEHPKAREHHGTFVLCNAEVVSGSRNEKAREAEAFEARALQHEIDHCDGLLFLDRAAGAHAVYARKTYL
jgi:peptide deformylase